MSLLGQQVYANTQQPLWLPFTTVVPTGPTGMQGNTGPTGPTGNNGVDGITTGKIYYFNKSQTDPAYGGTNIMSPTPLFNPGQSVSVVGPAITPPVRFAEFITVSGDPDVSIVPAGNWVFDIVLQLNVPYTGQQIHAEVHECRLGQRDAGA